MNTAEQQETLPKTQQMPALQQPQAMPAMAFEDMAMSADAVKRQVAVIQEVMSGVMKSGEHYGAIPGCGDKPTLLKPGAEKLGMTFRLAPEYLIEERDMGREHREYRVTCKLVHIPTGTPIGQGVGTCSTMESKFRFRKAEQKCPECGKETIIKSKKEFGGGWLCYSRKGGCGAKFRDGDPRVENQNMGRVEHDNPADYYNTCLKMGKKRAHVDAVLTATAASDIFTQDIEDDPSLFGGGRQQDTSPPQQQASRQQQGPRPASENQVNYLWKIATEAGFNEQSIAGAVREFTGRPELQDLWGLTGPECSNLINAIKDGSLAPRNAAPTMEEEMPEGY